MRKFLSAVCFILLGIVIAVMLRGPNAEDMDVAQYCDLVALHNSDPDLGWPDFRQRFAQDCNADGTVKDHADGNAPR